MRTLKSILTIVVTAAGLAAPAMAQSAPPTPPPATVQGAAASVPDGGIPAWIHPETPEKRMQRLGTAEDPGLDPDPAKHFWRFGKSYHIEKFERRFSTTEKQEEGWIRPIGMVYAGFELYQQNETWVWTWMPDPDPAAEAKAVAESEAPKTRFSESELAFLRRIQPEWAPIDPRKNGKTIRFEEASEGLPTAGSWRNSLAVADMNGDGFLDIIAPPQRGASSTNLPSIFLGDGKGHWKFWEEARFPHALDYGSVAAADFNKDGKMDLVFGVHLNGIYVFLGNGQGIFKEIETGVPHDFPTRRVRVADVDGDGWPDVLAVTEGPAATGRTNSEFGALLVLLNRKKGTSFQPSGVVPPDVRTGGDFLSIGNLNGDRIPDFAIGSLYFNSWDILYTSTGPGKWTSYKKNDGNVVPSLAYYFGSAMAKFSSKDRDDAILSYTRVWPSELDPRIVPRPPHGLMTSIDRFRMAKDGTITRSPIMRWLGGDEPRGLAAADFDGDGKPDVLFTRFTPREMVILLGDGKGGFSRARVEGLPMLEQDNYDVTVADVNGDGRPDVVICYEASNARNALATKNGSIRVYLNRGVVAPGK